MNIISVSFMDYAFLTSDYFWMFSSIYLATRLSRSDHHCETITSIQVVIEFRDAWVIYNVLQVTIKRGLEANNKHAVVHLKDFGKNIKEANGTPSEAHSASLPFNI